MRPLSQDLLDRLDLPRALEKEVGATRNLLPRQLGVSTLAAKSDLFCSWLGGQLRRGLSVAPNHVVSARKQGVGIRPVPIVGISERVVFRALTQYILASRPNVDRSAEAYLRFISGPVTYAHHLAPGRLAWVIGDSELTHVVKTDLTAFYQYIDHGILGRELLSVCPDFDAIECLIELLGEMEGRAFGLPQLLDPSDELSELYADMIQRALIREGFPTWRYNDDFRIACRSYTGVLRAIEALSRHARELGLVISEHKTFTPTFATYALDTLGLQVSDHVPDGVEGNPDDALAADYSGGDAEGDIEDALSTLSELGTPGDDGGERSIDLSNLRGDAYTRIRKAIRVMTRESDARALPHVVPLMIYVPALTPLICGYMASLGSTAESTVADLTARVSVSDWQATWLLTVLEPVGFLEIDPRQRDERVSWVRKLTAGQVDSALRAEATVVLARAAEVSFEDVEYLLRVEPEVLSPWYVEALVALAADSEPGQAEKVAAVRRSHILFDLMWHDV